MRKLQAIPQPLPLAKLAYEELRDSILTGHLKAGEVYNEMALSKELGISRTPVREALLELAGQGIVTFLPRKGVMVKYYTRRDVEEIFEVRAFIELAAVEKIARMQPLPDLSKMEKVLKRQKQSLNKKDYPAFLEADRDLHSGLVDLIGNQRLSSILRNIRDMIQIMANEAITKIGRTEEVISEHEEVIRLVKQGEAVAARRAMERHLELSREAVLVQRPDRS